MQHAGGIGSGIVLIWAWGLAFPDMAMPPEVAAALAPALVKLVEWALAYVPDPAARPRSKAGAKAK